MQIIFYSLLGLSALLGFGVGASGFVVGMVAEADEDWGWMIILGSVFYLAHPALLYWLFKKVHETLAMWLAALFLVASAAMLTVIL